MHLAQGHTIHCLAIRSGTIDRYLHAAAKISTAANQMDPRLDIHGKKSASITKVINEQKRWEEMPKRREPVTVAMIKDLEANARATEPDSLESALYDWNVMGHYYGFRLSEWAQNDENKAKFPLPAIDGSPLAFTFDDFQFLSAKGRHLKQGFDHKLATKNAAVVEVRWRFQKNLDNGQKIQQVCNREDAAMCCVQAAIRITQRAQRLNQSGGDTLAVFKDNKGRTCFITNTLISRHLRESAKRVYNIRSRALLARWSAHSIRVGACVSLSEAKKDAPFIQVRLRWRSQAFTDYLRNTITLAQ